MCGIKDIKSWAMRSAETAEECNYAPAAGDTWKVRKTTRSCLNNLSPVCSRISNVECWLFSLSFMCSAWIVVDTSDMQNRSLFYFASRTRAHTHEMFDNLNKVSATNTNVKGGASFVSRTHSTDVQLQFSSSVTFNKYWVAPKRERKRERERASFSNFIRHK